MNNNDNTILVSVTDAGQMRGRAQRLIQVNILAENVKIFLGQVENMMQNTPDEVGKFKFTEFTITAEVTAKGELSLLGTGGELSGGGGLTFKFERK